MITWIKDFIYYFKRGPMPTQTPENPDPIAPLTSGVGNSSTLTTRHIVQARDALGQTYTHPVYTYIGHIPQYYDSAIDGIRIPERPRSISAISKIQDMLHSLSANHSIQLTAIEVDAKTYRDICTEQTNRMLYITGSVITGSVGFLEVVVPTHYGRCSIRPEGTGKPKFDLDKYMEDVNASLP